MSIRKALITGIAGQDGSYLAELLLTKGYDVHGIVRRVALEDPSNRLMNIRHILADVTLHPGSVDNQLSVYKIINQIVPDECYHLAASSFVSDDFDDEAATLGGNVNSTQCILSSIKDAAPQCRFYFAGSSEMFGDADTSPQDEQSKFNPRSLYGISKLVGHHLVSNYRRHHGLFACSGILYNHESPRRGHQFVTRKITSTVARIFLGLADHLELGNIDARRDWGYAPEYVDAMWRMLNLNDPDDYLIASGQSHRVRDFLEVAFSVVNLDYRNYVQINESFVRPEEQVPLVGNFSKAERQLGWQPKKQLSEIVQEMIETDIRLLRQ